MELSYFQHVSKHVLLVVVSFFGEAAAKLCTRERAGTTHGTTRAQNTRQWTHTRVFFIFLHFFCAVLACSLALICDIYPPRRRTKAQATSQKPWYQDREPRSKMSDMMHLDARSQKPEARSRHESRCSIRKIRVFMC